MRPLFLLPLLWAGVASAAEPDDDVAEADTAEVAPAPPEVTAEDLAAIRAEMAALRDKVDAQQETIEDQHDELLKQRKGIADTRIKLASDKTWKFEISGYYRVRGHVFGAKWGKDKAPSGHLFESQTTSGRYMNQRLRVGTKFAWKDIASLNVHFQALDNVLFGDNADVSGTALFAADPSDNDLTGGTVPSFKVFRAWMEFKLPVGIMRVGRQSSHWGLGILANSGDGFDDDVGENHFGATFDRVLFGTNPVSIVQAITKKQESKEIPLILAIAVDRLVEDPLTQYYGYQCSPGRVKGTDDDFDPRCDADGDGTTELDHSNTEERDESQRRLGWWADQRDDVMEMVYALIYRGEDIEYFGGVGDLTAGGYVIHRTQRETDSNVVIVDGYLDASVHGAILQGEAVGILGKTRAISLPNSATPDDPLFKKANIAGYVIRAGYEQPLFKAIFETGYASGDDQVNDQLFTGRSLDPDYNVGMLLYEEVIKIVTERLWAGNARGLRSKGGVYNSFYVNPKITISPPFPNDQTHIFLGAVVAMPDKADGAVIKCGPKDEERFGCPSAGDDISDILGWEIDVAVKHRFHEHILVSLETAYAHASNRLPLDVVGLNTNGNFWTFQSRVAWEF